MDENLNKKKLYSRILIVIVCLGLSIMIGFNFFYVEPIGGIKNGIYILLSFLVVLILSESFDNFSIGQLISIKREIRIKTEENEKLEKKNLNLINHLISITNTQTQHQQNTNVFGDYYSETSKTLQPNKTQSDNVQELLDRIGNSIVITDIETRIRQELTEKGLNIEGETIRVLLRHLAGTQLLLEFEKIHSVIFGSQLYLLKMLNTSIPIGLPENEVYEHFKRVKQHFKDTFLEWDAERYLSFLYNRVLIIKDENNNIHITNLGVEYLTWITRNGLSEDKDL